ncbi:nitrilase-related carbon-nitrogen hydrolase [Methylobacterium aerolatum]|uniref:Amidohydrolase n=1 Tax=Methylobacterium aerolatum TaxID=418708 RepID=A0ABU0I174_9HYPH|nr:nitrilase-related carbon-nitrogen hydrolase [Methylobacterium aerolatum]MDQ0448335.1 putative amidohydrolase [Methylobacterium aerolatum]GJD36399.1 hypothetical protein FMGBMHLM_3319 [Methylobacterium aerolatum]
MSWKPVVTAAVVQAGSILFDTARTLDKLADLASDAAARGAYLAVFPEAFVGGCPNGCARSYIAESGPSALMSRFQKI